MMQKISALIDGLGIVYGLTNIQEILGIVVLVLTIVNILFNYGYKFYKHIKEKNFEQAGKDIEDATKELEDLGKKDK